MPLRPLQQRRKRCSGIACRKKGREIKGRIPACAKIKGKGLSQNKSVNSRIAVWILAQIHLFFAAFVLAVPIFVLVIERGEKATGDERYDHMAHEFIKVSMTALFRYRHPGGILVFMLIAFYPDFMKYLASVFDL